MGALISNVPKLLEKREWEVMDLAYKAKVSVATAYRLADGDTGFNMKTLAKLCEVFDVSVGEIVEYQPD